jgi:hypothetical protein
MESFDEIIDVGSHAGHQACIKLIDICGVLSDDRARTAAVAIAFGFLRSKLEVMKAFDPQLELVFNEFQEAGVRYANKIKDGEIADYYRREKTNG